MDVATQDAQFHVKTTDGVQLECVMYRNTASGPLSRPVGLLIFHPWAWLGGCMHDAVVASVYTAAKRSGCFNTVLKYNVRGAGNSTGHKALGNSASDIEDALTLCNHILCELYTPPEKLYLVAYSYGSCIAANLLGRCDKIAGIISIGFPLGFSSRLFLRSLAPWNNFLQSEVPKFLIISSDDQFTSLSYYTKLVAEHRKAQVDGPERGGLDVKVFENCDHFFAGRWQELSQTVIQWIQARELVTSATQEPS